MVSFLDIIKLFLFPNITSVIPGTAERETFNFYTVATVRTGLCWIIVFTEFYWVFLLTFG